MNEQKCLYILYVALIQSHNSHYTDTILLCNFFGGKIYIVCSRLSSLNQAANTAHEFIEITMILFANCLEHRNACNINV